MKNILYNRGYFLKEANTIIRMNPMSNIFSILSTGLIFFLLAMVASGWWTSNKVVEAIQGEAEISAYHKQSIGEAGVQQLLEKIKKIEGVREVQLVAEDEAYNRMVEILGKEAPVLNYLDDNPFSPFIEVKIYIEKIDPVLENLDNLSDIEYVRDNREVLERFKSLSGVLKLLGYLIVIAVGISTLVIVSHIIRLGIDNNREQINTLRLLGAPERFIALPFVLLGLMLTFGGSTLSLAMSVYALKSVYTKMTGPLPFIPLPPLEPLLIGLTLLIILLSIVLGIGGSLIGLSTAKVKN